MSLRKYSLGLALAALALACSSGETLKTTSASDSATYETSALDDIATVETVVNIDVRPDDAQTASDAGDVGGDTPEVTPSHTCKESTKECLPFDLVCNIKNGLCVACNTRDDCLNTDTLDCRHLTCEAYSKCQGDADCATVEGKPKCMTAVGECGCGANADCPKASICTGGKCVPRIACTTDLGCKNHPDTLLCEPTLLVCVDCKGPTDCGADATRVCFNNVCQTRCNADKDCSGATPHCKTTNFACVQCVTDDDCGQSEYCAVATGTCELDVCKPGATDCADAQLKTCLPNGTWKTEACQVGQACDALTKACQATTCLPNSPGSCSGSVALTCSADGKTLTENCGLKSNYCEGGLCKPYVCTPNALKCNATPDPDEIQTCASNGQSWGTGVACPKEKPTCTVVSATSVECRAP